MTVLLVRAFGRGGEWGGGAASPSLCLATTLPRHHSASPPPYLATALPRRWTFEGRARLSTALVRTTAPLARGGGRWLLLLQGFKRAELEFLLRDSPVFSDGKVLGLSEDEWHSGGDGGG